ncbi:sensor histidine kinase [Muricauda sp. HICW]|uniref:histidine kinase n=1 Tax=Flagellimonas chongwuensis TaxID=2697365 RepID=A0A850NND2_9FLAO|nr:sensor histidine kinase [Allomuricauda chongwuensis]NVN18847.1 sensor histidine kinase [Allomuricauda chongwuensis]
MRSPGKDTYRIQDKVTLILKVNYNSSFFAAIFGLACYFLLGIDGIVPYTFWGYAVINLLNTLLYKQHEKLVLTYNLTSILSMLGAIVITLYSGGIESPFVFVLAIIVFAGYVTTKVFGQLYLILNLSVLTILFLYDTGDFKISENTIPLESRDWFAYLSAVFAVYLLGGVFGKNLLSAHHRLYKSRNEIQERIDEKEILLKEVHHRVKNNLQTVSSLLSLQSRSIDDSKISNIIKSSQNRVVSMAMVHEMLYKRDDYLSKIELKPYVQELCDYLVRSVKGSVNDVKVNLDINNYKLSIDTVIPLGLIINETITNALKYGIAEVRNGEIHVSVEKIGNNRYKMHLGDNGIGYSEEINPKTSNSLGLKLIYNLARQLRGTITRDYDKKGTHYTIEFEEVIEQFNSVDQ